MAFHVFYALCILIVNDKLSEWFSPTWRKPFLFSSFPLSHLIFLFFFFSIRLDSVAHEYIYLFEFKRNELMLRNFRFQIIIKIIIIIILLFDGRFSIDRNPQFDGTWWNFWIPQNAPGALNEYKMIPNQIVIHFNFLNWKTINAQYSKLDC